MSDEETVVRASSLVGAATERETTDERGAADADRGERRKFTQRMPENLVGDVDEFAERRGMSRNAAINVLAKAGLDEF